MLTSKQSKNPRFVLEKVSTGENIFRIIPENIQGLGLTSLESQPKNAVLT